MEDLLKLLTFEWYLTRASVGVGIGYFLRVFEHIIWSFKANPDQNPHGNRGFALLILPQSLVIGLSIGYVLVAIFGYSFKNVIIMDVSAYLLPGFMSFIASDFRDLIRRISRI